MRHGEGVKWELLYKDRITLGMRRPGLTKWPTRGPLAEEGAQEEPQLVTSLCLDALNKRWEELESQLSLASAGVKQTTRGFKPRVNAAVDSSPGNRPIDLMETAKNVWKGGVFESSLPLDYQAALNDYFERFVYEPAMAEIRNLIAHPAARRGDADYGAVHHRRRTQNHSDGRDNRKQLQAKNRTNDRRALGTTMPYFWRQEHGG